MACVPSVAADRLFLERRPLTDAVLGRLGAPLPLEAAFARALCGVDASGHVDALVGALRGGGAAVFAERCGWAAVLLDALGGSTDEMATTLGALRAAIAAQLEPSVAEPALAVLDAGLARLHAVPVVTPVELCHIPEALPMTTEASPAAALEAAAARIAAMSAALDFARRPAQALACGAKRIRCFEDAGYHVAQLVAAVAEDALPLFVEYAVWSQSVLTGLGLPAEMLSHHLDALHDTLSIALPPPLAGPALGCVDAARKRLWQGAPCTESFLQPGRPHVELARRYLQAQLAGQRREACDAVLDAVRAGVPVGDVYRHVFLPCQYEVGRLWQTNAISIAREHACTAVTQLCMSRLYPHFPSVVPTGRRVLSACVAGNLHELGARFVADFFDMAGWDTLYLGASTPARDIVREAAERQVDVIAVSATLASHLRETRDLVAAVRSTPACQNAIVLLGGYPFRVARDLWVRFGADGSASDAESAVTLASELAAARSSAA